MVSFQNSISLKERKPLIDLDNPAKKRKWSGNEGEDYYPAKESKLETANPILDVELNLETPLPLEWQRCLDLQSGKIHFYNTRTHKRTCRDPRQSPEPLDSHPMSLELELKLNLPCQSFGADDIDRDDKKHDGFIVQLKNPRPSRTDNSGSLSGSLSWVSSKEDSQEMVAAVCIRCHMLVMLCKSSPSCPNCKFMHPPNQNSLTLSKHDLGLLCCKD